MSRVVGLHKAIVEDCKQNSRKAQMQLYDLYSEAMFVVAKRYVKDAFIAEDLMQEAFIKVFKHIMKFKGEVSVGAWIKRIVINQCIDYLKKKKLELVSIEEKELSIANEDDWSVSSEVKVQTIMNGMESLPEKYKVVLKLFLFDGFDHQEISQVLGITEATSRSQLMRGKEKLRNYLKAYQYV